MIYRVFIKRLLDIIFSTAILVFLLPVFLVVAVLVRMKLGSPVIFKQKRPGKNSKIFSMYKFRTMTDEKDESGNYLTDSVRLTKFGKMLRSTSLDELPELWNILKGDMSFVGPRPLLVEYLNLYTKEQIKRHDVRPGLTGWAQVNGRNEISWNKKFTYDVEYVENLTMIFDLKIIILTIKKVVQREGITATNSATIEKFDGEN